MTSSPQPDRGIQSDALRALLVCALAIAVPIAAYGVLLVLADLSAHGEDWDGLGIIFGSMLAMPALTVSGLAWVALRGARRRPGGGASRGIALVLGSLLAVPTLLAPGTPLLLVPMVGGLALVGVAVFPDGPAS